MADVSIVLPDGTEDEIEIDLCCPTCAGLDAAKFNWLIAHVNDAKAVEVPNHICLTSTRTFIDFVKQKQI